MVTSSTSPGGNNQTNPIVDLLQVKRALLFSKSQCLYLESLGQEEVGAVLE